LDFFLRLAYGDFATASWTQGPDTEYLIAYYDAYLCLESVPFIRFGAPVQKRSAARRLKQFSDEAYFRKPQELDFSRNAADECFGTGAI